MEGTNFRCSFCVAGLVVEDLNVLNLLCSVIFLHVRLFQDLVSFSRKKKVPLLNFQKKTHLLMNVNSHVFLCHLH